MADPSPAVLRGTSHVGVVLIHDIYGLDATNLALAKKLADEGFWVAPVDLFGRTFTELSEAMPAMQALQETECIRRMSAARDALRAAMGGKGRIGTMGFCMGGGQALLGACHAPFDFVIDYYGTIRDASAVKGLRGPVFLILASEDDRVNPWAYSQLLPALDEHRRRVEVQLYPNVHHAFHRPGAANYDEASADDVWRRVVAFLKAAST